MKPSALSRAVSRASNILGKAAPLLAQSGYKLVEVSGSVSNEATVTTGLWRQGNIAVEVKVYPGSWDWRVNNDGADVAKGHSDSYRAGWSRFTGAMRAEAIK